jgi:xanthine dehydrogenase accessory factor
MRSIFSDIAGLLRQGESFAVCTIMEKTGSVPRAEGARMIVRADGATIGTIGGGRIEAEMAAIARDAIPRQKPQIRPFHLSGEDAAGSEMICGGSGRVLIDCVSGLSVEDNAVFTEAAAVMELGGRAWLVTDLSAPASDRRRCLLHPDGRRFGGLVPPPDAVEELARGPSHRASQAFVMGGDRFLVEPLHRRGTAFIFGAGHVAQKIAPLCADVGFFTIVLDDRSALMDRGRFPDPIELSVIGSFQEPPPISMDDDSYVVIVTRGHLHDREVLGTALRSAAGYIGMMGSHRKRELLFKDLRDHGFTEKDLARVHTPIGLAIGAQTPEEIAVSVVGELIAVRAAREGAR